MKILNQFWKQFWSLIPNLVSDFGFEHQKYHFWVTKNAKKNMILGTQNGTSGAQNQNLKPVLEPVTKTDSKTCFRFEF